MVNSSLSYRQTLQIFLPAPRFQVDISPSCFSTSLKFFCEDQIKRPVRSSGPLLAPIVLPDTSLKIRRQPDVYVCPCHTAERIDTP